MAKVEYIVNPLDPPEEFAERLVDREAALEEIGALLLSEAQAAFRSGGWRGGTPWAPRSVPNVAGIIRDLAGGGQPKARRFSAGQVGVDTGRLRNDFDVRVDAEEGSVTLANFTPYADEFDRGGPGGPFPGAKNRGPIRQGLALFLRANPQHRGTLGWLFGVESWSYKEKPARPVIEYTDAIARDVRDIVLSHRLGAEGE